MIHVSCRNVLYCCVFLALLLPCHSFAGMLVVTSAKSPLPSLTQNQIRNVFLGKLDSLPDGRSVVPIDQLESNPLRDEFYLKMTNKSAAEARALWAKLYFTGRGTPPREAANSDAVKKILGATPGAIGYIDQSSLDSSVSVIFVVP